MAKKAPNPNKITIVLVAAFLVVTLLTGVLAFVGKDYFSGADKPSSSDVEAMASADEDESEPQDESSEPDSSFGDESSEPKEEEEPEEEPTDEPVYFNVPDEMKGVMLVAGRDYLTGDDVSKATLASQIDQALAAAKDLTMNSIIIDTKYENSVLFDSSALQMKESELDCTDYITTKAKDMGFYVYATYDVSDLANEDGSYRRAASADGDTLDEIIDNIGEFAEKYKFDGILLSNYYNTAAADSYAQYLRAGGGIGYYNYLRQVPRAMVAAAAASVREHAPGTQVGLLADAVWENNTANADGSETSADFTALGSGNADTKAWVESGMFDFVLLRNLDSTTDPKAPFRTVAQWWSNVAGTSGTTLYTLHANEKLGVESYGWQVMEQLSKQLIDLENMGVGQGSVFNSLKALRADSGGTTTQMIQYMNNQIDETYVLQQLSISKPAQLTYKTQEPTVTFQGASDPREPVTINGEDVPRNESGYFTIREDLKEGLNTFAISHKNKTFTYNITREIIVLKEVQPVGSLNVDGGMAVTVSALAYEGSTVTASIGGQNVTLSVSDTEDDETDRDSGYKLYTGVFTAPNASESATKMGTISFTAVSADGHKKTLEGAAVTVNKKAKMGDGVVVQVVADQAETFPTNTLNDNSSANYFPLPKGTVDKTYGDEVIYKNGKNTYSYWKLESGVRVYSKDITTGGQMPDNNSISNMSVKSSGDYTTVTLTTASKMPFTVAYDGNKLVFDFQYTATVPQSETFGKSNALFTSADWSGSKLTLNLKKTGGFLGYKAYYDDQNKLVLRFNNSPGALSGARIVVDPGHGGNDPGALGFYPDKDEADINLEVAKKLTAELKSRGANVLQLTPGTTMASRMASAAAFNPQVLVSVHCNTSANSKAKGTEVYYFYPFQKQLAASISSNVASALSTENRGAKSGLYYMTRQSQFACVLAELGFLSNESEYTKMIASKYQNRIAQGIANGINSYLGGTNSGGGTDNGDEDEEDEEDDEDEDEDADELTLNRKSLDLEVDDTYTLKATIGGKTASVSWESDDEEVATVSSSGKVTAVGGGIAYITAETRDGESVECEVNVEEASGGGDVTGVKLNKEEIEIGVGQTYQLSATVRPSNASNKNLKWESDDKDTAKVDSNGKVTGVSKGTAYITVTTKDGDYTAECEVTVGKANTSGGLITKIVIDGDDHVAVGSRIELTATVTPWNAEDTGVKWKSSNPDVAYIGSNTTTDSSCKVEGRKNGTATITATAYDDGKKSASFKITVGNGKNSGSSSKDDDEDEPDPKDGVMPKSVKIEGDSNLKVGNRKEYKGTVYPLNCEDPGVKWEVSSSSILELYETDDENIVKVYGKKAGTAYLIGRSYLDKDVYYKFKITVTK